ncbi:uncharacterized protein LOC126900074 [Daktulosphaira vitifoliae]|uniref:uncharacterized protein LOC126900074 n=1 Tax=Daktulosphaira vitifoliae TaxID=58002 RepID=UPI0021AA11F2|nr:uncharacterized protein LOC126900074 [Daktulosphaira vitifoliae]
MIILRLFICVTVYTKSSISLDPLELHCNFSRHLFNYFKYCEQYLFNFENTISEHELKMYGRAVKSHGEIVMIMLDSIRDMDEEYMAADIMTVNLYLNNVSGSINMIGRDKNGKFNRSKNSQNLLNGFKILHRSIVERLEYFLNEKCLNVLVTNNFISLTNFKKPIKYSSEVLLNELEKFNSKIITSLNGYLTMRDMFGGKDNEILNNYCNILKHLAKTFERKSYYIFNPKNVMFYDFMEGRACFSELDYINDSQVKQYTIHNSNEQLNDVLDIVRYIPLKIKSTNNYQINLSDVFSYIKFDFDIKNLQIFKKLLNTAIVCPILMTVFFYFSLVKKFVLIPNFQNEKLKYVLKYKIIEMGQQIVENMKSFMDLNLFGEGYTTRFKDTFNKTYELISFYKDRNNLFFNKKAILILKIFHEYIKKSVILSDIQLEEKKVIEGNIYQICDLAVKEVNKIASFVSALKRYQYCFEIANKYFHIEYLEMSSFKITFKQNIPFEQLGNHKNLCRSVYIPDVNTSDVNKYSNHSSSNENDEMNNNKKKNLNVETHTIYTPKYLIDYLLYE